MYVEQGPILVDPNDLPPPDPAMFAERRYTWGLKKFGASCGIYTARRRVKRREVISYVANKLGGVHLDREFDKDAYKALKAFDGPRFFNDGKAPVYMELMSIGQLLARSSDATSLIHFAEQLSEP